MAQCSLYDVRCLKGSSVLLFCSNLIPKLFKHQGFSSTRSIQSVCLSVCEEGRELEVETDGLKRPVRKADTVFIWLSCFFLRFTCRLRANIDYYISISLQFSEGASHLHSQTCWSAPATFSTFSRSPWLLQGFTSSLFRFKCRWRDVIQQSGLSEEDKHNLSLLADYSPVKQEINILRAGRNYLKGCLIIESASLKSLGGANTSVPFNAGYSESNNMFLITHLFN